MDLTAMVDVVFLLIIFFLTTSSLVELTRERVDLPIEEGEEIETERAGTVVVNVTQEGRIVVEGEALTRAQLLDKIAHELRAGGGDFDLLIRADEAASLSVVNAIAEGVAELGVRGWRLATEVPYGEGG
jgi:biopolymer transport protein ExbD